MNLLCAKLNLNGIQIYHNYLGFFAEDLVCVGLWIDQTQYRWNIYLDRIEFYRSYNEPLDAKLAKIKDHLIDVFDKQLKGKDLTEINKIVSACRIID